MPAPLPLREGDACEACKDAAREALDPAIDAPPLTLRGLEAVYLRGDADLFNSSIGA